jgi:hypothetical protein
MLHSSSDSCPLTHVKKLVCALLEVTLFNHTHVEMDTDIATGNKSAIVALLNYLRDKFDLEFYFTKLLREEQYDASSEIGTSNMLLFCMF